jgi:hypothetical protein
MIIVQSFHWALINCHYPVYDRRASEDRLEHVRSMTDAQRLSLRGW